MRCEFQGRPVEVESICHGSDVVDSFVDEAYWLDIDAALTDEECTELTDALQEDGSLYDDWADWMQGKAEDRADAFKDGTY